MGYIVRKCYKKITQSTIRQKVKIHIYPYKVICIFIYIYLYDALSRTYAHAIPCRCGTEVYMPCRKSFSILRLKKKG